MPRLACYLGVSVIANKTTFQGYERASWAQNSFFLEGQLFFRFCEIVQVYRRQAFRKSPVQEEILSGSVQPLGVTEKNSGSPILKWGRKQYIHLSKKKDENRFEVPNSRRVIKKHGKPFPENISTGNVTSTEEENKERLIPYRKCPTLGSHYVAKEVLYSSYCAQNSKYFQLP